MNHVPANLFEGTGIEDPWLKSTAIAKARRLLVTMWLLHPNLERRSDPQLASRARAVWDANQPGLLRASRVSVATALAQLKDLGFVRAFDSVEGGFSVELVKEVA